MRASIQFTLTQILQAHVLQTAGDPASEVALRKFAKRGYDRAWTVPAIVIDASRRSRLKTYNLKLSSPPAVHQNTRSSPANPIAARQ